jgi:hypothetical protein
VAVHLKSKTQNMKTRLRIKLSLFIVLASMLFLTGNVAKATVHISSFTSITGGNTYCLNSPASAISAVFTTCRSGSNNATTVTVTWYKNTINSTTGGTQVAQTVGASTGNSATVTYSYTPSTTAAGTLYYYVVLSNPSGTACGFTTTLSSTTVQVIVNAIPAITGTTPASRCSTGTVTLGAAASAGTINWYAASTGGSSLGTGTSFTTPPISATTTYYVDATSGTCTSSPRTAVTATVNALPIITFNPLSDVCVGSSAITLSATPSGGVFSGPYVTGNTFTPSTVGTFNITYSYTNPSTGCVATPVVQPITVKVCTPTWNGHNTDYHDCTNWAGGICPGTTDDVIIPASSSVFPVLNPGEVIHCHNMDFGAPAKSVAINPLMAISGEFIVDGNLTIRTNATVDVYDGGWVTINGNLIIQGSLVMESGSSLITNGSITGSAIVKREIPADLSWHLLSSPVIQQNICNGIFAPLEANFGTTPVTSWDFYKWQPNCPTPPVPAEHWQNLRTPAQAVNYTDFGNPPEFVVTKGYLAAYGSGFPTTKAFTGTPNTGDKVCSFFDIFTECSWDLEGNPFPSAVDWSLVTDKGNLSSEYYYVWNENKSGGPGYEFWKDNTHYSSSMIDGKIPPMQGFFIKANPGGSKFIGLPNSARVHDDNHWLKNVASSQNKLTLTLSNGTHYDEAIVMFEEGSSAGQDPNDAEKLFTLSTDIPQVYAIIDNDAKAALNSLSPVSDNTTVPLGFVAPSDGNYSLTVSGIETFGSIAALTLEDKNNGLTQNLLVNPVYSFSATGNEDAGRFLLHFSGSVGGNTDDNNITIFSSGKTVNISCPAGFHNAVMTVSNLLGQNILTRDVNEKTSDQVTLGAVKGFYIVKVRNDSSVRSVKVYID